MDQHIREELILSKDFFEPLDIHWISFQGHAPWPAQLIEMNKELMEIKVVKEALKYKKKSSTDLAIFYGTGEYGFVNPETDITTWNIGIMREYHLGNKVRLCDKEHFYQALDEVLTMYRDCDKCNRKAPERIQWLHLKIDFYTKIDETVYNIREIRSLVSEAGENYMFWGKNDNIWWPMQMIPPQLSERDYSLKREIKSRDRPASAYMLFGTGSKTVINDDEIFDFDVGLLRGWHQRPDINTNSEQNKFHYFYLAIAQAWGILQNPRIWPSSCHDPDFAWWCNDPHPGRQMTTRNSIMDSFIPRYDTIDTIIDYRNTPNPRKRPIDTLTEKETISFLKPFLTKDGRGWGLKTEKRLEKGQLIGKFVGELTPELTCRQNLNLMRIRNNHYHFMLPYGSDEYIDARRYGNLTRFINSSCEPNCSVVQKSDGYSEESLEIVATCPIEKGTEICINYFIYGLEKDPNFASGFSCRCGRPSCALLSPEEREFAGLLIGQTINVRWENNDSYPGRVMAYCHATKKFKLLYEDGDMEHIMLHYQDNEKENFFVKDETLSQQLKVFRRKNPVLARKSNR